MELHKISRRDHRNYGYASKRVKSGKPVDMKRFVEEITHILDHRISYLVEAKHRFRELLRNN